MNLSDYRTVLGQVLHAIDEAITEGPKILRPDQMEALRQCENAIQDIDNTLAEWEEA